MKSIRIVALAIVLAGCRMGGAGTLVPVDGGTITNDSIAVRADAVVATIEGQWAAEASQAIQIQYTNGSSMPVRIALAPLRLHRSGEEAALWSVSDMTAVNRSDARTNNDVPPVLYDAGPGSAVPILTLPPRSKRTLALGFTNFTGKKRVGQGDIVSLDLRCRTMSVPCASERNNHILLGKRPLRRENKPNTWKSNNALNPRRGCSTRKAGTWRQL